jgi:hypothetical protein
LDRLLWWLYRLAILWPQIPPISAADFLSTVKQHQVLATILAKLHDRTLICPMLHLRILDEHLLARTKKWLLTKLSATFALSLLCKNLLPSLLDFEPSFRSECCSGDWQTIPDFLTEEQFSW